MTQGGRAAGSHFNSYRAHERQRVAVLDDAVVHAVIEGHRAVDKLVLKVDVLRPWCQKIRDLGQGKVMSRDQPDGPVAHQTVNNGLGADAAVVRVGSLEQLVK